MDDGFGRVVPPPCPPRKIELRRGLLERWNDVRAVLALPQLTVIGHRPGVVFEPTIHVHDAFPWTAFFGSRPAACEGPLL